MPDRLAELHVHLEGTVRHATAAELAGRNGLPTPPPYDYHDLASFLAVYAHVSRCPSTVVTEWEGWANPAEFSALLEAELHALRDHHGTRQLLDCRRQKGLRQADQEKADREWLPRALAAGLKRFAVVLPISGLAASNLQERLGKVPKGRVEVKFFTSIEEAKLWLVH